MTRGEGFTILKLPEDGYYKVFACWKEDSRWKLSSGGLVEDLMGKQWPQHSGSIYSLEGEEGACDFYQAGVLKQLTDAGAEVVTFESL